MARVFLRTINKLFIGIAKWLSREMPMLKLSWLIVTRRVMVSIKMMSKRFIGIARPPSRDMPKLNLVWDCVM